MSDVRTYIFILGTFISFLAAQFLLFVIPLLVYQENRSIGDLGYLLTLEWLPVLIAFPFAGHWIDRHSPIVVNRLSHLIRGLLCTVAFVLIELLNGHTFIIMIALAASCAFLMGLMRLSADTVISIGYKENIKELARFQSLLQSAELSSLLLGATLAGLSTAWLEKDRLLLIAGLAFGIAFITAFSIHHQPRESTHKFASVWSNLKLGMRRIMTSKGLLYIALINCMINLLAGMILGLNPAIVVTEFKMSEAFYGYLNMAGGISSIAALSLVPWAMRRFEITSIGLWGCVICIGGAVLMALSPVYLAYMGSYLLFLSGIAVYNIFNRTERVKLIPIHSFGSVIGAFYVINGVSIPLAGLVIVFAHELVAPQQLIVVITIVSLISCLTLFFTYLKCYRPELQEQLLVTE